MKEYAAMWVQVGCRILLLNWILALVYTNPVHLVLLALYLVDAVCSYYFIKQAAKAPMDDETEERITQNAQKQIIDKKLPTYGRMIMFVALVELQHHRGGLSYTDLMNKVYYNTGASLSDIPIYVKYMMACKYIRGELRSYTCVSITWQGEKQLRKWLQDVRHTHQ